MFGAMGLLQRHKGHHLNNHNNQNNDYCYYNEPVNSLASILFRHLAVPLPARRQRQGQDVLTHFGHILR